MTRTTHATRLGRTTLALVVAVSLSACHRDAVISAGRTRVSVAELRAYQARRTGASDQQAALAALAGRALLAEAARRDGLDGDPEVQAQLETSRREILAQAYFTKALAGVERDDLLQERYQKEKKALTRRQVHVAQIAFHFRQGDPAAHELAQSRATRAYARVIGGEPFEKVARETSEDAVSAPRGGDLGPVLEGEVDAGFFQAAVALKQGEVAPPFETPFGFHLVKALEPVKEEVPTFDQARSRLTAEARREAEAKLLQRLRAEIGVTIHAERAAAGGASGGKGR